MSRGHGQDTYQHLEGCFGSIMHKPNAAHANCEGLEQRIQQNLKSLDRAQFLTAFNLSRPASHFGVFRTSKSDKK